MTFPRTALAILLLLSGCASIAPHREAPSASHASFDTRMFRDGSTPASMRAAEGKASPAGEKILAQARLMTVEKREILPGACWDYVNAVWNRAGFPPAKRKTTYKTKKAGPYAKAGDIQPGDWLYFINHSYNDIEHSALFVDWADERELKGYMLSYAGEKRAEPARYLEYDLSSVYQVIRAKE